MRLLLEAIAWCVLSGLPAYGGILALRQVPEIDRYLKARPSSIINRIFDVLLRPWKVEAETTAAKSSEDSNDAPPSGTTESPPSTGGHQSNAIKLSVAWVIDFYPGKIRIPGGFALPIVLLLCGALLLGFSMEYIESESTAEGLLMLLGSILAIGTSFLIFSLIWGQVFRKTKLFLHERTVRVDDVQGDRTFKLSGPLRFRVESRREFPFGTVVYVVYENVPGPLRRLMWCPTILTRFVLSKSVEVLVGDLNSTLKKAVTQKLTDCGDESDRRASLE
ncbi:MAG: hypothetical protein H6978_04375 [Gammaproteobacteria bacterium]|nr:hypothetical protein [Gammaproteobacteria bacterium]